MNNQRKLGLALIGFAVLLFIIGYAYVRSAEQALFVGHETGPNGECLHPAGAVCPYAQLEKLEKPKYAALFFDLLILIGGLLLFLQKTPEEKTTAKALKGAQSLGGTEARVFTLIVDNNGIYQSELAAKSELSKVALTRVLDRLESKNLIERKRRGMTNIITLKR